MRSEEEIGLNDLNLSDIKCIVGYPVQQKSKSHFTGMENNSLGFDERDLLKVHIEKGDDTAKISVPDTSKTSQDIMKLLKCDVEDSFYISDRLFLLPINRFSEKTAIGRLLKVLQNVETSSHILVWARGYKFDECGDYSGYVIEKVELPRLHLSFSVNEVLGDIRLESLEYVGYWLSNVRDKQLESLTKGMPFKIIVENFDGYLAAIVPTFSVICPSVERLPFCVELVPNRR